jgi:hypothetical protein
MRWIQAGTSLSNCVSTGPNPPSAPASTTAAWSSASPAGRVLVVVDESHELPAGHRDGQVPGAGHPPPGLDAESDRQPSGECGSVAPQRPRPRRGGTTSWTVRWTAPVTALARGPVAFDSAFDSAVSGG